MQVLSTALVGADDHATALDSFAVDGACHYGGGRLESSYHAKSALGLTLDDRLDILGASPNRGADLVDED